MNQLKPPRPSDSQLADLLADFSTRIHPCENPLMDEEEVARVLQLAEIAGIPVIVDGGWAVDALLGWQTREHSDLDLAINQQYLPRLLNILRRLDYQYLQREDEWAHNFVLENGAGHRIDLHSFVRNSKGQIIAGVEYPGDSLTGQGRISGMDVCCIHPEWLVDFHLGYDFDHQDYQDLVYICNLYKLSLPPEYQEYANNLYENKTPAKWQLPARFHLHLAHSPEDYLRFINILEKSEQQSLPSEKQESLMKMMDRCESPEDVTLESMRTAGLRAGVLLFEGQRPIGASELVCLPDESETSGRPRWHIRQISLAARSEYSSLFMALLRESVREAWRAGAGCVEALPLDDICQPRPAIPPRYDLGEIGFASFFARAGFGRLQPLPGSRWALKKK